ncbi:hypothetical protein [Streptomyces sp. NBC_01304]|uniref:hypothetical protein n=1 Tax=Streptomyces sp. NBC_01304 TaxID=2903818 RepID=UPI002E13F20A|nr:hypothetical protein OG430_48960 [Streptomyces sp. NBC_01304]
MGAVEQARIRERIAAHPDAFYPKITDEGDALLLQLLAEFSPEDITEVVQQVQQQALRLDGAGQ